MEFTCTFEFFQEDVAKSLLAEFNLGCRGSDADHRYRLYVATFLGFGGNSARTRYEKLLLSSVTKVVKQTNIQDNQGADQDNSDVKKINGTVTIGNNVGGGDDTLMPSPTFLEPIASA